MCPWNRYADIGDQEFSPRHGWEHASLEELWALEEADFERLTAGMAIRRAGYTKFRSNLAIAIGNAPGSSDWIERLKAETSDDARLSEHVRWALDQQRKKCSR